MSLKRLFYAFTALAAFTPAYAADIPNGPITLKQCIEIAIENNLDIRIINYTPQLAALNLESTYGAYDPAFSIRSSTSESKQDERFDAQTFAPLTGKSERDSYNFGLSGLISTGLRYDIGLNASDRFFESGKGFRNQNYDSNLGVNITQPLLQGAWAGNSVRRSIKLNKKQAEMSTLTLLQQLINTVSAVENAYYSLVAQKDRLKVDQENLDLTQQNLDNQRRRADVGAIAKSDLPQLEAELFSQKKALIDGKNSYANAVNNLKRLLTDDFAAIQDTEILTVGELNPVKTVFSRSDSWDKALNQRSEILRSKIQLEMDEINLKYSKNQLWPQLNLRASYGLVGNSGKDPIRGTTPSLSKAFRKVRDGDFPNSSISLNFSIPIPNRSARASYKTAQLQKEQAVLQHKNLEQQIMLEVDRLIRSAESNFEQISATRQARISSELAYQNQIKRFEEGAIDNYTVLLALRDLTRQRNNEIAAKANYLKALSALAKAEGSTLDNNNINVEFEEE